LEEVLHIVEDIPYGVEELPGFGRKLLCFVRDLTGNTRDLPGFVQDLMDNMGNLLRFTRDIMDNMGNLVRLVQNLTDEMGNLLHVMRDIMDDMGEADTAHIQFLSHSPGILDSTNMADRVRLYARWMTRRDETGPRTLPLSVAVL